MRRRLVGTGLGETLLRIRRWRDLRSIPLGNPERAAMIANAILAERLIERLCLPGATFLDIGAHIGSVLASVHRADPSVQILAVEADPEKARNLRTQFPFCTLFEAAVSEAPGTAEFFIHPGATGYNTLVPGQNSGQRSISVELARLDDLLPEARVDLIKIDIEGAELGALKGGQALIDRGRPTILFESTGTGVNELGYSATGLWQWFETAGYAVVTPDRLAHDAPPLTLDTFLDAHAYPFRSLDFFAVHRDRHIEIRDRARRILGISAS